MGRAFRRVCCACAAVGLCVLMPAARAQWYTRFGGSMGFAAAGQFTTPLTGATRESDGEMLRQSTTNSPGVLISFRAYPVARSGIELNYLDTRFQTRYFDGSTGTPVTLLPINMHEVTAAYLLRLHWKRFEPYVGVGGGVTDFTVKRGGHDSNNEWRETGLVEVTWNRQMNWRFGVRVGARELVYLAPHFGNAALGAPHVVSTAEPFAGVYIKLNHE